MRYTWIGILCCLLGTGWLNAQVSVSAELSESNIMIGDQVELKLVLSLPNTAKIELVDLQVIEKLDHIELLESSRLDTVSYDQMVLLEQRLKLTSFDSGYYFIPPIPITYNSQGVSGQVATNQLALSVNPFPLAGDSLNLAPIKPILLESKNIEDYLVYIIAGGSVLILALVLYLIFGRKTEKPPTVLVRRRPAYEVALEKLEILKSEKLWQQGQIKEYHSQLTFILRDYLEHAFKIPALESTTEETMQAFKALDLDSNWDQRMREMLQRADMIKFAKAEPPLDIHAKAMTLVADFIHETKNEEIEIEETAEALAGTATEVEQKALEGEPDLKLAPIWARVIVYILDSFVITLISLFFFFVPAMVLGAAIGDTEFFVWAVILLNLLSTAVGIWMMMALEVKFGGLPFRLIFGQRVKSRLQAPITYWQAFLRFLFKVIWIIPLIGVIIALVKKERELLHDRITKTNIFQRR